jgi:hypothetical protein
VLLFEQAPAAGTPIITTKACVLTRMGHHPLSRRPRAANVPMPTHVSSAHHQPLIDHSMACDIPLKEAERSHTHDRDWEADLAKAVTT